LDGKQGLVPFHIELAVLLELRQRSDPIANFLGAYPDSHLGRTLAQQRRLNQLLDDLLLDAERLFQPLRQGASELAAEVDDRLVVCLLELLEGCISSLLTVRATSLVFIILVPTPQKMKTRAIMTTMTCMNVDWALLRSIWSIVV